MSESCSVCYALLSDHKRPRQQSVIQCSHTVKRYAHNTDGAIASLYDGWIDDIVRNSNVHNNFINKEPTGNTAQCLMIKHGTLHNDFLRIFDIDNELWLSIALNMSPGNEKMVMLHNYRLPIDRNVHFLYYYCNHHQHRLINDPDILQNIFHTILVNSHATHIITNVIYGIDFMIKLEFPLNENSDEIDIILNKVCNYFSTDGVDFLTMKEQEKLNQLTPSIFSRITEICSCESSENFSQMCQNIRQYLVKQEQNVPLWYTLHPIKIHNSNGSFGEKTFVPLDFFIIKKIQEIILNLLNKLKSIEDFFDKIPLPSVSKDLEGHYNKTFEHLMRVRSMYKEVQVELATIVLRLRRGDDNGSSFDRQLNSLQHKALDCELTTLHEATVDLKNKDSFITKLQTDYKLRYYNVADLADDSDDNQQILEEKILQVHDQRLTRILCSSSELMTRDASEHHKLCQQLMDEQRSNPSLYLVFVDFSYCKFVLPAMQLLSTHSESLYTSTAGTKEFNLLLLGETGIGKSTFINAFVNYLAYQSIDEAKKDGPIVLIPVSFVMTDDQSDECEIKLGEQNNSNEDFDHPGQTITQHCQSYLFDLGDNTKLRFIDTPGIGDTRGILQDDKNIQYILSYVNQLSHLNAVCILMKSNTTRLHVLFRSCLEQIFSFLGPNVRDNIVFCFTSGRSTFFLPGNTAPLLKKMLNDLPPDHTPPLGKANMFCFDSEAFRYLAAMKSQRHIQFKEEQKADFQMSWNRSVEESIRFMHFIKSRPHYQMNTWHSIKHAQILITSLIRPILETIRHILRNQILNDTENKQYSVKLQPESLSQSSYLCTTCPFNITSSKILPMVDHSIHQYRTADECEQCPCPYSKHLPVLYKLKYALQPMERNPLNFETNDIRDRLLQGSVIFAYFLLHTTQNDEDPFLSWLDLYIQEEVFLCSQDSSNNVNRQLHKHLIVLRDNYETQLNRMKPDQEAIDINEIYQWIEKIQQFQTIKDQLNAIKESEMKIMQYNEYDVLSRYSNLDRNTPLLRSLIEHS